MSKRKKQTPIMPDPDEMPLVRMPKIAQGKKGKRRAPPDDEFDNAVAFMD